MFRSDKQNLGLIVGLGAAASFAVAACYALYRREEEGFDIDPKLDSISSLASFQHCRPETLLKNIPKEAAGVVIGKGCENLKLIQRKTNTKITFANGQASDEVDRTIIIKGTEKGVATAGQLIDTVIEQFLASTQKINVKPSEVGIIIGRNGSTIKAISEASGAKVNVPRAARGTKSSSVPIEIRGDPENVKAAIKLIEDKLKQHRSSRYSYYGSPKNGHTAGSQINFKPIYINISNLKIAHFERLESNLEHGVIDIYVSYVSSPSKFWVQPCGVQSTELDRLMVSMTDFYEVPENQLKSRAGAMFPGDIYAAPLQNDEHWYRVKIVEVDESTPTTLHDQALVTVLYLDFGYERIVLENQISVLHEDFLSKLPFQAIECSLSGISPPPQSEWSEEATDHFKKLSRAAIWEKIFAKVTTVDPVPGEPRESYSIDLIDIKGEGEDLNIAQALIEEGYAVSTLES